MQSTINHSKAVFLINLHYFVISIGFLLSKVVYNLNPELKPVQLLGLRSMVSTLVLGVYLNTKLKNILYESLPPG
jgi:hypothetical protein